MWWIRPATHTTLYKLKPKPWSSVKLIETTSIWQMDSIVLPEHWTWLTYTSCDVWQSFDGEDELLVRSYILELRGLDNILKTCLRNWLYWYCQNAETYQMRLYAIDSDESVQASSKWMRCAVWVEIDLIDIKLIQMIFDHETDCTVVFETSKSVRINTHIDWNCHTMNFEEINLLNSTVSPSH